MCAISCQRGRARWWCHRTVEEPKRQLLVVIRSCFWADAAKDPALNRACQEAGGIFVNAGPLGGEAANAARSERPFKHEGVAGHPGDRGMQALADAIVQAMLKPAVPPK